jgi:Rod binding domain-containing protein
LTVANPLVSNPAGAAASLLTSPLATTPADPASSEYPKPRDAAEAARQFEALLIGQMLRTAHESGSDGGLGASEDSTGDTMWDVSAQQFAQVLANNGGLGLARLISQGLDRHAAEANPYGAAK